MSRTKMLVVVVLLTSGCKWLLGTEPSSHPIQNLPGPVMEDCEGRAPSTYTVECNDLQTKCRCIPLNNVKVWYSGDGGTEQ